MGNAPEFLQIFQRGGPYAVKIIFEDHEGKVCDQNMEAEDFCKLIDSVSGLFYESIYVDVISPTPGIVMGNSTSQWIDGSLSCEVLEEKGVAPLI